jgi:hypothetical protein
MEHLLVQTHRSIVHSLLKDRAYESTSSKKIEVEIHLSGLSAKASHPEVQKVWIIGLFSENRLLPFTVKVCTRV